MPLSQLGEHDPVINFEKGSSSKEAHMQSKQIVSVEKTMVDKSDNQQIICFGKPDHFDLVMEETVPELQLVSQPTEIFQVDSKAISAKPRGWKRTKVKEGRLTRQQTQTEGAIQPEPLKGADT
ncbi:formate--tetrahydrofolate ligase [Striga asiatica]|uniref:Formate--tetrahydrofolate ligase n=1 Tax=Striga asiatica TaxID=4170 RepID=A0A5A7RH17_STRAF|nr:formate--tetrahydrofolate ligase [Striga asiatica]